MDKDDVEEWFEWMDELRASGCTNTFGMRPLLAQQFDLDRKVSAWAHVAWMKSFNPMEPVAKRAAWAIEQENKDAQAAKSD